MECSFAIWNGLWTYSVSRGEWLISGIGSGLLHHHKYHPFCFMGLYTGDLNEWMGVLMLPLVDLVGIRGLIYRGESRTRLS